MRHIATWDDTQEKWIWHEIDDTPVAEIHYVQNDIEFASPDGAQIGSRSTWREHLKRTGSIEIGVDDLKASAEKWTRKKAEFQERTQRTPKDVEPVGVPEGEIRERQWTELDKAMANRLDNRPAPDRKLLVKLAIESARELAKRQRV